MLLAAAAILLLDGAPRAEPALWEPPAAQLPEGAPLYVRQLERRLYAAELDNQATRTIADGTAADILSGGADLATTGWAIAAGAVEGNPLVGGSRNSALIIAGTKAVGLATTYFVRRAKMNAWKSCMLARYDGRASECNQRASMRRMTWLTTAGRILVAGSNAVLAFREGREGRK